MPEEITGETEEQSLGTPSTDNPLDALTQEDASVNAIEIADDTQYRLANGNVLTGNDIANLKKGLTQSTQKYSQQVKDLQDQLGDAQKETAALREYISAYAAQTTTTSTAYPSQSGYDDYSNYNTPQPTQTPIDINKIAEAVEARVLQAVQQKRLETERLLKDEARLRAEEEEVAKLYPGLPIKDFTYKATAAVNNGDFKGLVQEHLKLLKVIRDQDAQQRKIKAEQARKAMLSGAVATGSTLSNNNNKPGKRLTSTEMREKIKESKTKAKAFMQQLNSE